MDLRRIDLNLLVTLDVLLSERNVTLAGQRLGLSQPAVSSRLARLRTMFGDRLFTPARRGLAPTARALDLRQPLARLLAELDALVGSRGFDPARTVRTFRVVAADAVHAAVTAPVAAALQDRYRGLSVAMLAPDGASLERRLAAGEVDLLLVASPMMPVSAITKPLYRERFVCVARPGHPALERGLSIDAFCHYEHVLVSTEGGGFRGAVDDALEGLGRRRSVRTSVPNFLVVPELLRESDLIATVPSRVARLWAGRLSIFEPPFELPGFAILVGWGGRSETDDGLAWLRGQLAEFAAAPCNELK